MDVTSDPVRTAEATLSVNGRRRQLPPDPRTTVLDALREHLGLTGSKKGCDHGQCGACTVLLDGRRANACLVLAISQVGVEITTIEGLGGPDGTHPAQRAFLEHDGYQCGYCTPGQICSAVGMITEARAGWPSAVTDAGASARAAVSGEPVTLDDAEVRERMSGNLCRCGAYAAIVPAVRQAAAELDGEPGVEVAR